MDNTSNTFYVVLRSGNRVSDTNHETMESAQAEANYWLSILKRWPDGTKILIEPRKRT